MKRMRYLVLLCLLMMIGCVEKGTVNVDLNKGYSEFTIQSKHKAIKSIDLALEGESSCELRMLVSKNELDTIGTGVINFSKNYPWRAGEFKVKLYSPRCKENEHIKVSYQFNK